jgi:stage V sporulation protein G
MKNPVKEIQIIPVKPSNGLIAFCSFILFDSFYCSSIGIFTRPTGGYRLVYPTKKAGNKEMNLFHPISKQIGIKIEQEVIKKLEDVMKNDRYCST